MTGTALHFGTVWTVHELCGGAERGARCRRTDHEVCELLVKHEATRETQRGGRVGTRAMTVGQNFKNQNIKAQRNFELLYRLCIATNGRGVRLRISSEK